MSGILKGHIPAVAVLATTLACGLAHTSVSETLKDVPSFVELVGDVAGFLHRVATSFNKFSERMDPTCSECNRP